jgi:CubicO group peptidase (beta-lactamase class C family)
MTSTPNHPFALCLLGLAAALPTLPAQSLGCHDLQALPPISQQLLATAPNSARHAVRLDLPSGLLYEQSFGTFTPTTVVPIASATKTLSAAVLMSLVDSNVLTLDDRVGQYLPEWNSGARATITLRMCFAHTAGMPGNNGAISDETITLRQAAQQLATVPLLATPGSEFRYGGVSMHVAGAVCEVASGQSWATLFAQRIAGPLQMTQTDFQAFGPTQNPRIAGGARSTLRDFARFMAMLRDGGVANGATVLSAASVQTLLTAQTVGIPIASSPHPYLAPYGIGIWIDRRDSQGRTLLASGVGAFGFHGWVDRAHALSGTMAVQFLNQSVYPFVERIQAEADAAVLPVRTGAADFALRCDRAPAGLPGVFLVGAPDPVGVPLGDLASHLGLDFAVVAPATADALGRAALPAPLVGVPAGSSFGLQTVWLSGAPCLALLLQASHAVRIDVLP